MTGIHVHNGKLPLAREDRDVASHTAVRSRRDVNSRRHCSRNSSYLLHQQDGDFAIDVEGIIRPVGRGAAICWAKPRTVKTQCWHARDRKRTLPSSKMKINYEREGTEAASLPWDIA